MKYIPSDAQLATLTKKELFYYNNMKCNSGVVFLTGPAGIGKTAILKSIAKKLGYQFFDERLSTYDESDLGIPKVVQVELDGRCYDVMKKVIPEFCILSNMKPTIIDFEELNRCSKAVQNAALGILLERIVGNNFTFNENVIMVATGNLGEQDGNDVEYFDSALNNRLIHIRHSLSLAEWIEGFADKNVSKCVISFLKKNSTFFYKYDDKNPAFPTPRSWTFVSDYSKENKDMSLSDLTEGVMARVGVVAGEKFIQHFLDENKLTIDDVLNKFDENQEKIKQLDHSTQNDLLEQFKSRENAVQNLKPRQLENLGKFLELIRKDAVVGFLHWILVTTPNCQQYLDRNFNTKFQWAWDTIRETIKGKTNGKQ